MKRFLFLSIIIAVLLSSCHKKQNRYINYKPVINASNDYTNAQQITVRLLQTFFKVTGDTLINLEGYNPDIDGAVCTYFHDTITDSVFYKIKYGSWGVVDPFGKRRGGDIYVNLDGNINDSATTGEFVFENFHYEFDSLRVENLTIKNAGLNDSLYPVFHISAERIKWNADSVHVITWAFEQTYEQKNHGKEFLIWGEFSGTAKSGINFRVSNMQETAITTGYNCAWLKNGEMDFYWGAPENRAQIMFPDSAECRNVYSLFVNDLRFDKAIE